MNQDAQANPMGTRKVYPLLITMSLPPMISMLIQSMYNVVDSIFVAKLGEDALTGVSDAESGTGPGGRLRRRHECQHCP